MAVKEDGQVSRFRRVFPQVLVTTINNLLLLDLSMMLAFPTLVIGDLYHEGSQTNMSSTEESGLFLDQEQASWLGSLVYIFQPLGSSVSGLLTEPMGRRLSMMVVNVTPLVGWLMTYWSNSVAMLYASNAIMGLGIGFMEAPVMTYCGKISEPSVRGMLTAYTGVLAQTGYLLVYSLGVALPWRQAALVSAGVPIFTVIAMYFIPESPMWLLSRGRDAEALAALQWLRGWVSPEQVHTELQEMKEYAELAKRAVERHAYDNPAADLPLSDIKPQSQTPSMYPAPPTESYCNKVWVRIQDLMHPETRRPLGLVVMFFFFFHTSGMSGVRPYMIHIIDEYHISVNKEWVPVATAVLGLGAVFLLTGLVSYTGKRILSLISIAGCCISCFVLGTYAKVVIGGGYTEFPATWVPLTMLVGLSFFTYFGVGQIPWMYVSEVFSLRTRATASGVSAAAAYILYFLPTRTYLPLEAALGVHGVFWLNASFSLLGFVLLYRLLPETEGLSLDQVGQLFQKKQCNTKL